MQAKFYFCFPYRGVGGVSLLFLRLAEELSLRGVAECYLVDYADGFMAAHRNKTLAGFAEYRDDEVLVIPPDAIAIFQSMTPWSIFPSLRLSPQTRILFWNCHPFNLIPTLPGLRQPMQHNMAFGRIVLATLLRSYRSKMSQLIRLLLSKNSLIFMDWTNVRTTERYLGMTIAEPVYLPIPAPAPGTVESMPPRDFQTQGLRLAWVGRIADFKYPILKYSLRELNRIQSILGLRLEVLVVGMGDFVEKLRVDVVAMDHIDVKFIDYVPPDQLDDFLLHNVDVLLAMGTSALEGAKLGIPTLLLDVAYGQIPEGYLFQWLHERKGFSLGDVLGPEHVVPGNRSLVERIEEIRADHAGLSDRAVQHFEKFHALPTVALQLLKAAHDTQCTWGDLVRANLNKRGVLYSIFKVLRKGWTRA